MEKVSLVVRSICVRAHVVPQVNHIAICVGQEHQLSVVYTAGVI